MTYTKEDAIEAIINYDEEKITEYVGSKLVNRDDIDLLNVALAARNLKAFELLIDQVEVNDRNEIFAKTVDLYSPIALVLVEKSHFENETSHTENKTFWQNTRFFPAESCMPHYFTSRVFNNNKEAYVAQILSNTINSTNIGEDDILVFNYLVENRKQFNISDEQIVQHLVENNYEIKVLTSFKNETIDNSKDFFARIVNKLVEENVDFSSDTNGLMIQIAAFNELPNLIPMMIAQGSNINGFMERYSNGDNWLSNEGLETLYSVSDYNNERHYDIDKKFDDTNILTEDMLIYCENLKNKTNKPKMKI